MTFLFFEKRGAGELGFALLLLFLFPFFADFGDVFVETPEAVGKRDQVEDEVHPNVVRAGKPARVDEAD